MGINSPRTGLGAALLTLVAVTTTAATALRRQDRPEPGQPTVAVLIPAHNEAATIVQCIEAVRTSTYPVAEIVVVADACTDNTADLARQAGATRVLETNYQDKAQAQNAALGSITADILVGFDGDTWPDPDCIRIMVEQLEREKLDATCSTILPAQGHHVPYSRPGLRGRLEGAFFTRSRRFAYALGRRWWRLCQAKVGRIQVLTGACYAFRTYAIQSIGGFPNGLITADMDATWMLHGAGYRLGYAGEAMAYTMDPEDFRTYRNQMRRWSSGYFQNMAKHRRQLGNWRSLLVVGGSIFDLVCLFVAEVTILWTAVTWSNVNLLETFALWTGVHSLVSIVLVASVVGVKEALLGFIPYTLVNYYNKWLYFCAFVREWLLGRHYASWTGRQGRAVVITPMTAQRKRWLSVSASFGAFLTGSLSSFTGLSGGYGWWPVALCVAATVLLGVAVVLMLSLDGSGKRRQPNRSITPTSTRYDPITEELPVARVHGPEITAELPPVKE